MLNKEVNFSCGGIAPGITCRAAVLRPAVGAVLQVVLEVPGFQRVDK